MESRDTNSLRGPEQIDAKADITQGHTPAGDSGEGAITEFNAAAPPYHAVEPTPCDTAQIPLKIGRSCPDLPGYQILEELGRGGMGTVYRAHDIALNRDVAVKILQQDYAPISLMAQRFVEEAQITGQLQHPAIPAVYNVGKLADGRPFLAMKLIRGDTLADLLQARQQQPQDEPSAFNTLAVFEAICQGVGYAHAHNVIHRDLKPANVMVGAFGEVQVMDWGLAKIVADTGQTGSETTADPEMTRAFTQIRSARDTETIAGSILGTPAYMAPEQAAGETAKIDPRTDVFGLGAILCVMLTGKAPFGGADVESVRLNAVRGKTEEALARLDACAAEPDVVALCKKCLAFEPADRPANGSILAEQVARLRQGAEERAKHAELEQARAAVQVTEQRKRRRVMLIAGSAVAIVLLAGIVGTTLGLISARRASKAESQRAAKEQEAKEMAIAAEKLANDRLEVNRRTVTAFATEATNIGTYHPLADEVTEDITKLVVRLLSDSQGHADVGTLTERGLLILATRKGDLARIHKKLDEAEKHYQEALDLAKQVVATEVKEKDKATSNLSFAYIKMGELALDRKKYAEAIDWFRKALALRQQLVDQPQSRELDPVDCALDLGRMHKILAEAYFAAKKYAQALPEAQTALELLEKHAAAVKDSRRAEFAQIDLGLAAIVVGNLAFRSDQPELGRQVFERAILIFSAQLKNNPQSVVAHYYLSKVYSEYGDWHIIKLNEPARAKEYFQLAQQQNRALNDIPEVVNIQQTGLALGYYRLGLAAEKAGRRDEALKYFQRCLELRDLRAREIIERFGLGESRMLVDAKIDSMLAQARCGRVDDVLPMAKYLLKLAANTKPSNQSNPDHVREANELKAHYQLFAGTAYSLILLTLSPSDPKRSEYTDKALTSIGLALDNGFDNWWFLENDADLDGIRFLPEYRKLIDAAKSEVKKE